MSHSLGRTALLRTRSENNFVKNSDWMDSSPLAGGDDRTGGVGGGVIEKSVWDDSDDSNDESGSPPPQVAATTKAGQWAGTSS